MEDILKKYGVEEPVAVMPTGIELGRFKERISREEIDRKKKELEAQTAQSNHRLSGKVRVHGNFREPGSHPGSAGGQIEIGK